MGRVRGCMGGNTWVGGWVEDERLLLMNNPAAPTPIYAPCRLRTAGPNLKYMHTATATATATRTCTR